MELFKLLGTIGLLGVAETKKDMDGVTDKAEQSKDGITKAFSKIGKAVVSYFAIGKIKDFGLACINAAADANAMESQFTQVFGDMESQASASLSKMASEAGITENRMKGSYTKIAAFAKTTGMETADALSLADRAMVAVADSAAFYDRSLEETTESLQSFLKGNFENDAALGLSCTETTRNAAANELYGKSFKDLSESQKQLTLLKMVEDANELSGALGQASRESDTWANQTGNLKQAWTDFKATVGANFLTPAIGAVKMVTGAVVELTGRVPVVVEWFKTMYDRASVYFPAIQAVFQSAWAYVQNVWNNIGKPIFDDIVVIWEENLKPCLAAIGEFIRNVLAPAFEEVFTNIIGPVVDTVFNSIKSWWEGTLKPVFTGITDFITGVFTLDWEKAWEGIGSIVDGVFSGLVDMVKTPINLVIDIVNGFIAGLNELKIPDWVPVVGGKGINIPLIPKLEKGGILDKGQVGFLEGTGAEAVVPLDQNRKWISAVARDMEVAVGGTGTVRVLEQILEAIQTMDDGMKEKMSDAFGSVKLGVNNREFARMVKAVN